MAIRNVKESMAMPCEHQNDFRARAETINKGREVVLGKAPEVAVQVNNQSVTNTTLSIDPIEASREYQRIIRGE
jgi:hypothetical protein